MKLPFNLPKFGKKEVDEDDDTDVDTVFDPSELEGDPDVDPGDTSISLGEGSIEGETAIDDLTDGAVEMDLSKTELSGEFKSEPSSEKSLGSDEGQVSDESLESEAATEEIENLNFSDDDNDNDIDEDEDEDEDDKKEPKKRLILVGGIATSSLILIGGIYWYFTSDGPDNQSSRENSNIPRVALDIAPKIKRKVGGLNAIIPGSAVADVASSKQSVPIISPMAFSSIALPNVTEPPLGESNDPALSEESEQGFLPVISEDGRQAWQVYAKPFENQNTNPRVAIVVRGLGQSKSATNAAIQLLPGNVTLAFDPYAPNLSDWMKKARAAGHEVMLMVPLEPATFPYDDPGPLGLMTINSPEENLLRLENILGLMTGYIGVMTVMGSKFNNSDKHLRPFLEVIKKRGLMFLEGTVNAKTLAPKIATEIDLPSAVANVVLDLIPTKTKIDAQLAELETFLVGKPAAVAIAEGYPFSIERIISWTADLEEKNIVLAPLSAIANKQFTK